MATGSEGPYDLVKLVCLLDYTRVGLDQLTSTSLPLEGQYFRRQKGSKVSATIKNCAFVKTNKPSCAKNLCVFSCLLYQTGFTPSLLGPREYKAVHYDA